MFLHLLDAVSTTFRDFKRLFFIIFNSYDSIAEKWIHGAPHTDFPEVEFQLYIVF